MATYSLRSRGEPYAPPTGPAELIPARPGTSREGTGGSSPTAQTAFLEMVGLLESADSYTVEPVLTYADAQILSSALNHEYHDEIVGMQDKYFTPEEYQKVTARMSNILATHIPRLEAALSGDGDVKQHATAMVAEHQESEPAVCECSAHRAFQESSNDFYCDCLGRLVSCPSTLTDHYGGELAEALLPFIFKKAEMPFTVRKCGLGSPFSVNFILQLPSGQVFHFTGRPDYSINKPFKGSIARFTLKGVGEVQSPPGRNRRESKTAALSQAGVYTVGQFTKEGTPTSLPAVVIHKDKSAQVAMASINHGQGQLEDSIGTIHFRLVGQLDPIDLKTTEGMLLFSSVLAGVLKDKTSQVQSTISSQTA